MIAESITQETIENWLSNQMAKELNLEVHEIDITSSFMDMGLSSLATLETVGGLEDWLNIEMDPSEFWDYPTIQLLSEFLMTRVN